MSDTRYLVSIDIETNGGTNEDDDGPNLERDSIICVALYCEDWFQPFHFYDVRTWDTANYQVILAPILLNPKYVLVGHNLQFDLGFLKEKGGLDYPPGDRLWDTMLAERLLTAGHKEERVNLAATVHRHFGVVLDKSLQTSFTMDTEITQEQIDYIRGDVEWLPELVTKQAAKLSEFGMNEVWEVERHALPVFTSMWSTGVLVSRERLDPLLAAAQIKKDTLEAQLQEQLTPCLEWPRIESFDAMQSVLDDWNERRDIKMEWFRQFYRDLVEPGVDGWNASVREAWEEKKWLDPKINKKDGYPEGMRRYVKEMDREWRTENPRPAKPKLDTDLINLNSPVQMPLAFSRLGIPLKNFRYSTLSQSLLTATEEQQSLIRSLMEYKKVAKLLSSFGERMIALIGSDGRVRGNFNQIGTDTGRPTCTDPNMLQMPKDVNFRSCFIASPGYVFIVADYSQMELRIMAQLSKDKAMMEAFKSGVDLHSYTAHLMFGIPLEAVDPKGKERKIAKTINFGVLYGMGPNKLRETLLAEGVPMTYPEAKKAIETWKSTYKSAAKMIEQLGLEATTLGYTSTPFGRRRFFNTDFRDADGNPDNGQKFAVMREGANHPIQGTNADITKLAMHLIEQAVGPQGGGVRLNIYDETVTEVPEHLAEWAKVVVESCMIVAAEMVLADVPAQVDATISRSWSDIDAISA